MTEPLTLERTKSPLSEDLISRQQQEDFQKKIPKHRRPKFKVESTETQYKKIDSKRDQSQRLQFTPFHEHHETTIPEEVSHVRQTLKASSKIAQSCKFQLWQNRDMNNRIFVRFSQGLKKARGLKTVDFDLNSTSRIKDLALKNISVGLKPLKHLQCLKIRVNMCPGVTNRGFAYIGKAIKRLSSLQTLDFRFNDGGRGTVEGFGVLWRSLKYLKELKTLNMTFSSEQEITFSDMAHVNEDFKWFKSLKAIKLDFVAMVMRIFQRTQNIIQMLHKLTDLEEIHLALYSHYEHEASLKELMEEVFERKLQLKKIILDFGGKPLKREILDRLKQYLLRLNGVKEIITNLGDCPEVIEEGKEQLKEYLEGISALEYLEIKLRG